MSQEDKFDGMFFTIAQQAQGIEPLLETLFSFLRRKTDFFSGASKEQIEELILKLVRKHADIFDSDMKVKRKAAEIEDAKKRERMEKKKLEEGARNKAAQAAQSALTGTTHEASPDEVLELSEDGTFDASAVTNSSSTTATATATATATNSSATATSKPATELVDTEVTESEEIDKKDDGPAPEGNGGRTERYVWTQTLGDLTVNVPLPPGTKAKMLYVEIKNTALKVSLKGNPLTVLLDGDLHARVVVDDCLWTVEDGELVLTLQKDNKMQWWKCVIVGDPEIDTQKVQPENSKLSDLDGETRQTVEKMMFDQRQKAMGLPSSEELEKQEMLKKFMAAHPEMDFSKAKFN